MEHGREREPVVCCRSGDSSCVLSRLLNLLDNNISPGALSGWRERTMAFWKGESSTGLLLGHAGSAGQSRPGWAALKLMTQGGYGPHSEEKVWAWG